MVEVGRHGESLAHHIACCKIDSDRTSAVGGLSIVALNAAYQRLALLIREVGIKRQVVADAFARTFHLQYRVESYDFVAHTYHNAFGGSFDDLSGSRVECQCAAVAIFGVELHVVFERGCKADEGGKLFGYRYR